jgi:hypothetical protein
MNNRAGQEGTAAWSGRGKKRCDVVCVHSDANASKQPMIT